MKKLTILNVYSIILILVSIIYTIWNWNVLSHGEGWGVVFMVGFFLSGFIGLIIDFILRYLIKNRLILNVTEFVIVFFFSIELWIELN
jgi:hypothetical protein